MSRTVLFPDPALPWEGDYPYRSMEPFGVSPASTAAEVLDASLGMSPDDLGSEVNTSWHALRMPRGRLLADFFLYELPAPPAPVAVASGLPSDLVPRRFLLDLVDALLDDAELRGANRAAVDPPASLHGPAPLWELPAPATTDGGGGGE